MPNIISEDINQIKLNGSKPEPSDSIFPCNFNAVSC